MAALAWPCCRQCGPPAHHISRFAAEFRTRYPTARIPPPRLKRSSNLIGIEEPKAARLRSGDAKNASRRLRLPIAASMGCVLLLASCFPAWGAMQQHAGLLGSLEELKDGFTSAFLLILFSELGDKTFFIAALLAARKSGVAVFAGTFGALVAMTLVSVVLGRAFHYIDGVLPFSVGNSELPIDDIAAVALLIYFGISTLVDAAAMEGSAKEEQQEAELAIAGVNGSSALAGVVTTTFALVFVAEWGDKSFFSTIALAAASSPEGVVAGAVVGHGIATMIAVLGGSILGNYVSERVIALIGGTLFLVFAADTLYGIVLGAK